VDHGNDEVFEDLARTKTTIERNECEERALSGETTSFSIRRF